jgi:hypothetical protein
MRVWSRSTIDRSSIHSRSASGSSTGRIHHQSIGPDKSPGLRTNRPGRDFAPAPIRSVPAYGSPARSRIRASGAPHDPCPEREQQMPRLRRTAKLPLPFELRDFATLRAPCSACSTITDSRGQAAICFGGDFAKLQFVRSSRPISSNLDTAGLESSKRKSSKNWNFSFSKWGMRWTCCGTLLFSSVTRLSWFWRTWKRTTGFSDFWPWDTYFIFTTEAFTRASTHLTNGSMKSGSVSPSNIDGPG